MSGEKTLNPLDKDPTYLTYTGDSAIDDLEDEAREVVESFPQPALDVLYKIKPLPVVARQATYQNQHLPPYNLLL